MLPLPEPVLLLKKRVVLTLAVATLQTFAAGLYAQPAPQNVLADYIAQPDSSYHWQPLCSVKYRSGEYTELLLTSQTWHSIAWRHQCLSSIHQMQRFIRRMRPYSSPAAIGKP